MNPDPNTAVAQAFRQLHGMTNRTIKRINAIDRLEQLMRDAQAAVDVVRTNVPLLGMPESNIERAQREADRIIATTTERIAQRKSLRRWVRNPDGARVTRWQVWMHDTMSVTIDGVEHVGTVTSMSRGPVAQVTLTDGRTIVLRVIGRAERPKRKPRGRGVIAPPAP